VNCSAGFHDCFTFAAIGHALHAGHETSMDSMLGALAL
jgi:hypothetical protein